MENDRVDLSGYPIPPGMRDWFWSTSYGPKFWNGNENLYLSGLPRDSAVLALALMALGWDLEAERMQHDHDDYFDAASIGGNLTPEVRQLRAQLACACRNADAARAKAGEILESMKESKS